MQEEILKKIGLTSSEVKVYLALLKIGDFSSKGKILKEAKIAPSKIYYVLDKLIEKGLASTITKNNIKHFAAAPPRRLKDYIESKKKEIAKEEKEIEEIIPKLEEVYKVFKSKVKTEMFIGWKGMETAYKELVDSSKKGDYIYILGASKGVDIRRTKQFFLRYSSKARLKGINVKIIFNEDSIDYIDELERELGFKFNKKFLFKTSPVEILTTKDITAVVILKEEPIVILIHDRETADNFIIYFKEFWKIAKK